MSSVDFYVIAESVDGLTKDGVLTSATSAVTILFRDTKPFILVTQKEKNRFGKI
jgi:hypothetical protein